MAIEAEVTVRAALERAGVTASDEEIGRLVAVMAAGRELPAPGRTVEPHSLPRATEWNR